MYGCVLMKISIVVIEGFLIPLETYNYFTQNSNEKNLNSDSGFCILFYAEKNCDRLENYARSEISSKKKV